jgi:hypothetical protein
MNILPLLTITLGKFGMWHISMKFKFKNQILIWGTVILGGAFLLGTIIPVAINLTRRDKVTIKFNQNTIAEPKFSNYYGTATKSEPINQEQLDAYWVKSTNNTELQLAEIIFGITKFLPTIYSTPTYAWECTIYDYQHRLIVVDKDTKFFQFKFWYQVDLDYHPKNPDDIHYASTYRAYIDWTRPKIFNYDKKSEAGSYFLRYDKLYSKTPEFSDWELRFNNFDFNIWSSVFANQGWSDD